MTISRWERGVTTPSLYRQAQIIAAVGEDPLLTLCDGDRQDVRRMADSFLLQEPWTRLRAFFFRYRVADHLKDGITCSEDEPEEFERFQSWIASSDEDPLLIETCRRINAQGQLSHQLIRHHDLLLAHMVMMPLKKSSLDALQEDAAGYFKGLEGHSLADSKTPCYLLVSHVGGLCDTQLERCLKQLMYIIMRNSNIHGLIWRGYRGDADSLCNALGMELVGRCGKSGHFYLLERERLASQLAAFLEEEES
ncbi:hypothetical protein [Gallaecimonas sp. GXIMD4217]|uniref:hypothetical protein n=1 Tax=Gallaecimonas sp. GXIMD4217 TaxID=3131927 RepID=UPI00311AE968